MAGKTSREMKFAFAKYGTNSWGVAAVVNKGAYFEGDGGWQYKPAMITDPAFNQTFIGTAEPGNVEAVTSTLTGKSRYNDHQFILQALAMGSPGAVTLSNSVAGQTASFQHIIDLAPTIDGLGATFALDKSLFVEELTSAKITGFEETNIADGAMQIAYKLLGSRLITDSSVNIASVVGAASFPALGNRVMKHQGVFRMNANSGNTLASTDVLEVEDIKWGFERAQDAPHVYGQDYIAEPAENGYPEFMVEVKFTRMTTASATNLAAALRSGGAFKADWTFTGISINATDRYTRKWQFPYLQFVPDGLKHEAVPNGVQVKPVAKFRAALAGTSPSGMPFLTPARLTLITPNSPHAFA